MIVNQVGEEVVETPFEFWTVEDFDLRETQMILVQVLSHLKLEAVRTNATKHGTTEIEVRPVC